MARSKSVLEQEQAALQWGGICGVLGSLSLVAVFVFLSVLIGLDMLAIEAEIQRFPDIRVIRVIENTMYLLAIALWSVHSVVLFIGLRRHALAPALLGVVFMILGLCVLAVGAIPHTMTDPISDLYHAAGASPARQDVLVIAWTAVQGLVDTLVITGLTLTPLGMGFLGLAMHRSPDYGRAFGRVGLFLAAAGFVSSIYILVGPSDMAALGIFAVIFFHAILGWRSARLRLAEI